MPRSSRHRPHKERKHSSKDIRDYSDSEEDVKMKERESKDEDGSVRVSKELLSGEKRRKDGKNSSGNGNGDVGEEFVSSKRRKEKADGGGDRWNGGGDERIDSLAVDKDVKGGTSRLELDRGSKSREKVSGESKSKSTRRVDAGNEKDENLIPVLEIDESRTGGRADSKRKLDKDSTRRESSKDIMELKDKERGSERERKILDAKRDAETRASDGELVKKQRSHSVDDRQGKGGRENTDWSTQDDQPNLELEKDFDKRSQRRRDNNIDKEKVLDESKGIDERRLSSKDGKHKDEKHKDRNHGDQYKEDGKKDGRHRDDKSLEDGEKDKRHKEFKHRDDGEKYYRHIDEKVREDADRSSKRRDDKHREDVDRDSRHRDDKYREDGERDHKYSDSKYREDGDNYHRQRDNKYLEDGDREKGRSTDRYRDDVKRDDRHREDKYREDGVRDTRHKEEKHKDDLDRDSRHWDVSQDDTDREKRLRDGRYREEHSSRDRSADKSDSKRLKDEGNTTDYYRKSSNHDGSPSYEKRGIKYKEEQGKRRAIDKEDHGDVRFRSCKEERADTEKRSGSVVKIDAVTDRGRSSSWHTDLELNSNQSRRRGSPSSNTYTARDHYRMSNKEDPRYRDYAYEEKAGHNIVAGRETACSAGANEKLSSSRLVERHLHMDDGYYGELSAEKRPNSDTRASPLRLVDKSPPSTNIDRRHVNRTDMRRSLDIEESAQKSGGSREPKEGRGSRELPMDSVPIDEFSQADGDNISVSSPFPRNGHFSGNSRCRLPPPYRSGGDNPFAFGSSEDDSRGRPSNRHRRIGDPSIGRVHSNAWKGVPNWAPPLANGFLPFQHGPPPVNFHPLMQQFPGPPLFGVRPPMDLNHTGVPYHMPEADRFSSHGRPLGWRNPMDESCPPPLHGWDSNNTSFGDESHAYGRLDWDHNRPLSGNRGRETSGDTWKGQNGGANLELTSPPPKEVHVARESVDDIWTNQLGHQAQTEQTQPELQVENTDSSLNLSDISERKTLEVPKTPFPSEMSKKGISSFCDFYLSKLDISTDLTQPELYDECMSLLSLHNNEVSDKDHTNIFFVEGVVENKVMVPSNSSPFAATKNSVYQKALSLYQKQRKEFNVIKGTKIPFSCVEKLDFSLTSGHQVADSTMGEAGELDTPCGCKESEITVPDPNHEKTKVPSDVEMVEELAETPHQKLDDLAGRVEKVDEHIQTLGMEKAAVSTSDENKAEHIDEEKYNSKATVEQSDVHSSDRDDEVNRLREFGHNFSGGTNNGQKYLENKFDGTVNSEGCEAVIESIESESVNLSRIHHSPESTH